MLTNLPIRKDSLVVRFVLTFVVMVGLLSACSTESPSTSQIGKPGSTANNAKAVRVQLSQQPEISVEKILADVVGKQVSVPNVTGEPQPMDWTFAADEPKKAEIIEGQEEGTGASLIVQMYTSGAPGADDEDVQLSGKLKLHYERNGRNWILRRIENLTFRYTQRIFI